MGRLIRCSSLRALGFWVPGSNLSVVAWSPPLAFVHCFCLSLQPYHTATTPHTPTAHDNYSHIHTLHHSLTHGPPLHRTLSIIPVLPAVDQPSLYNSLRLGLGSSDPTTAVGSVRDTYELTSHPSPHAAHIASATRLPPPRDILNALRTCIRPSISNSLDCTPVKPSTAAG